MTVQEAFHRCWAGYWNKERFHNSGWAREVQGYFRRRIENTAIAGTEIHKLTVGMVREWHAAIGEKISKTEANRAMEVLSRVFSYAEEQELIPLGVNPCRVVKSYPEGKRSRYATPDEVRRISKALDAHWRSSPRDTAFLFMLLLTGARPSALERARWASICDGVLRVEGKSTAATGENEAIALPEYVLEKILPRIPKRPDGYLFGEGLPQRLWDKVKTEANVPDLWARDLRRTFATFGMSDGVDRNVIGELLNHKSAQTTMIYARLLPRARLVAVNRIADGLVEAMGVKE